LKDDQNFHQNSEDVEIECNSMEIFDTSWHFCGDLWRFSIYWPDESGIMFLQSNIQQAY